MSQKKIVIAGGFWSTNIGNAFFQLGGHYIMSQAAQGGSVQILTDQPGYWKYGKKINTGNALRLLNYIDADYIVLHGSVLTYSMPELWKESFDIYTQRKIRVILLGAGQFDYSQAETTLCRDFLKNYPPYAFISRDSITYENFKGIAEHDYNGIDNAYFLPLACPAISLNLPDYLMLNFDKGPEPTLRFKDASLKSSNKTKKNGSLDILFDNKALEVKFSKLKSSLSKGLGKYYGYAASALRFKQMNTEKAGRYLLVRADHQCNPLYHKKLYYAPNAFAMDVPYGYLQLYANSSLTLSDRIHACIVTMAYGNPAMLFSGSPRTEIIKQIGAEAIKEEPTKLNLSRLEQLRREELSFMRSIID